ncbi:hypothetical protein R3P38DRAFT_2512196, partial [Favolaschia claudopus]
MAEPLIHLAATFGLQQVLPPGTPTFWSERWKIWTTIDLAFVSAGLEDAVLECRADHGHGSDHRALVLKLDFALVRNSFTARPLYRETDWEKFHDTLMTTAATSPVPVEKLNSPQEVDDAVKTLTELLQGALEVSTPMSKPSPYAKRWWSKELSEKRREYHRAARKARRARASDECRAEAERLKHEYFSAIRSQKRKHWKTWLEEADERSVWLANKYASAPANPTASRVPPLKRPDGSTATSSQEKCEVLLDTFFPPPPAADLADTEGIQHPDPLPHWEVNLKETLTVIRELSPYKAPGLTRIPNIALQRAADFVAPILTALANACIRLSYHPSAWRIFTTVTLRK